MSGALQPGQSLGRYRITQLLGSGAMGDVYLAEDPHIERKLAIKTVRIADGKPDEVEDRKRRLLREAKAAGRLIHPHVVTLFDAGEADGVLYLAFEFIDGPDLAKRLLLPPPLSMGDALRIAREAASALGFAHQQGIVHRDVKPSNILLDAQSSVKVADFGIAKMVGQATELTMTGSVVGSPHYLSPEQVRGEELDGRTDIFSLGVVLYEMLGHRRPFAGETLTTLVYQILHQDPAPLPVLRADLQPQLDALLRRMLAKDREQRFPNAQALVVEIGALERSLPADVLAAPAAPPDVATGETVHLAAVAGAAVPTPGAPATATGATLSSAPTVLRPAATAPTVLGPAAASAAGAPPLTAAAAPARKSPLLWIVLGVLAVGALAVGGGLWMFRDRLRALVSPPPEESAATATTPAATPSPVASPSGQTAVGGQPAPSIAPPTAMPEATRSPAIERPTPRSSVPPSAVPSEAPPVEPSPRPVVRPSPRSEPSPVRAAPEPSPVESAPAPSAHPLPSLRQEIEGGVALAFNVEPPDAFIRIRRVEDERGIMIGQASDYSGKKHTEPYSFPGHGDYVVTLHKDGYPEYNVLVHVKTGAAARTLTANLASIPTGGRSSGGASGGSAIATRERIGFKVAPDTASLRLDGRVLGPARDYSGGFGRWLKLDAGSHSVVFSAPGYRDQQWTVRVSSDAAEDKQIVQVALERQ